MERPPREVELIGVAMGLGGPDASAADGPMRLREAGLTHRFAARGVVARWARLVLPNPIGSIGDRVGICRELNARVARRVASALERHAFPLVLGGDHSIAAGTWAGAVRIVGRCGLVWLDAHMDAHTPATSPSGNPHGMPLATLLGADGGAPALDPADVVMIGIRRYEAAEAQLLRDLRVRIYYQAEVDQRGLESVLGEAIHRACAISGRFGITLDLDAIDPYDAPGTGTTAAGGIAAAEMLEALDTHACDQRLVAAELVEFSPRLDTSGRTLALALQLAERLGCAAAGAPSPETRVRYERRPATSRHREHGLTADDANSITLRRGHFE